MSVPLVTLTDCFGLFDPLPNSVKLFIAVIALGCIMPFGFSRIVSIFIRNKKDLDEWERTARTQAESFTLRFLLICILIVFLAFNIVAMNMDIDTLHIPGETILYILGNLLMFILMVPAAYIAWTQPPLAGESDPKSRKV